MFSRGTNVEIAASSFLLASFEACFDCAPVRMSHFVPFTRGGYHENKMNFLTQQAPYVSSEPDVPTIRQTKPTKPRLSKYSEITDTTSRPPPPPTHTTISDKHCPAVAGNTGKITLKKTIKHKHITSPSLAQRNVAESKPKRSRNKHNPNEVRFSDSQDFSFTPTAGSQRKLHKTVIGPSPKIYLFVNSALAPIRLKT